MEVSGVVISGAISKLTMIIPHIRGPITPLITTHEPPSKICQSTQALQLFCTALLVSKPITRDYGLRVKGFPTTLILMMLEPMKS